jgi:hypothetical protein
MRSLFMIFLYDLCVRVSSELSARSPDSVVINRFIGASPGSSALQSLLHSLTPNPKPCGSRPSDHLSRRIVNANHSIM